ncbi:aminotransferase class I/II-fold pyridoxal phosphate-dependent enzyme [Streptomyces seoulensis]|nr:aminotransferase class I/II-fold pyridoxal phosphate-dependent enzyme [Streptomyces seoulensis]
MAGNVTSLFPGTAAHGPSTAPPARDSGDGAGGPVDFRHPCNPYFPTPAVFDALAAGLREILTSRPSDAGAVTAALCDLLQLPPQCVALGNGATELITWLDHLLVRESLAVPVPTFGRWTDQPMETGKRVDMFPLQEADGFALDLTRYAEFIRRRGSRTAVLRNPNDPDGGFLPRRAVVEFLDAMADLDLVVVDESFLEFADAEDDPSVVQEAVLRPNVVVLRSLGDNLGLHGVRLGHLVANPSLAGRVRAMLPKGNLGCLAERMVFMLREHGAEYRRSIELVRRDRTAMAARLAALPGLTVYPSQGDFLFVRLPVGAEGTVVRDRLLAEHRVLVRACGDQIGSSSRFLRLVVRPEADVRRLVPALQQVLYDTGAATAYSSGTAAVDRLVRQTNGAGVRLAPEAASAPVPTPFAPAPDRRGRPAAGGLTAAQVRGRTQPEPAVPPPLDWPAAGGPYGRTG